MQAAIMHGRDVGRSAGDADHPRSFASRGPAGGHQALQGRMWDRSRPERGRLLDHEVDAILGRAWQLVDEMLPEARLEQIPARGDRQNLLFAVLTVAAYRALRDAGLEREYAMELVADVGWKVYERVVALPRGIARLLTRDPQRRLEMASYSLRRNATCQRGSPAWIFP
jgi:hypothetical protein